MKYSLTKPQAKNAVKKIREAIATYFKEHKLEYAVFGKSEGLDSSVIAGLLSHIPGIKPIGVLMPAESNIAAAKIGKVVLEHFKIPYLTVDLTREFHEVSGLFYQMNGVNDQLANVLLQYKDQRALSGLAHKKARALGNIKARLRMITLYHIAQLTGGLVVSTDNYSEYWMGFWTLNGDVGDLAPIQQIFKGLELYTIAEVLGVPEESLEAIPTDGLEVIPGGVDQDQLKLPYKDLDRVIIELLRRKLDRSKNISGIKAVSEVTNISEALVEHVAKQLWSSSFKRHVPVHIHREDIGLRDFLK